jgi:ankyrin repeat protein
MKAARNGNKNIVQLLINKGADVNAKSKNGNTALTQALIENHIDIEQLLLNKGAK